MNLLISQIGTLLPKEDLHRHFTTKQLNNIRNDLTVRVSKKLGQKYFVKESYLFKDIYSGDKQWLAVARFAGIDQILRKYNSTINYNYVNKLIKGRDISCPLEPGVDLFDYQQVCYDYLLTNIYKDDRIAQGLSSCVFVMDTGLGKTRFVLSLIERFRKKTLILLPSSSGLLDWISEIKECFPGINLGQYHSKEKKDGDIVLMLAKSAVKDKFTFPDQTISQYNYFKMFGMVVFDEIHDFAASGNQEIFWRVSKPLMIGVTATPNEREDKMDIVCHKHLGQVIRAKDIPGFSIESIPWKGHVKIIKYTGPLEYTEKITNNLGWTSAGAMCRQMVADPYRNKLILQEIIKLCQEGYYTFVFAEHCQTLDYFRDELTKMKAEFIDEAEVVGYRGGSSAEDKEKAEKIAKIVLTTFQFGKQSLNIKKMNAIIFVTPRRNKMRQILGRIFRKGSDITITRKIIDIVDVATPLKSQLSDRKKIYQEKNFTKEVKSISYLALTEN